ncbi:Uncharacterized protein BP5553_00201 [Venustampulla echinocandica]|uniref:Uncharacterized protein n=1 Tax=Venustampulla echinocandica TaxID=2656787 RepID=A0A370TXH5_9HELO|nr:Uncharacterized protein BP5553_00201 [Venustampulla echinocandica]RDL40222.1 Uncharacterized protein BP5553_00201 [Venustampulla echinocandica]
MADDGGVATGGAGGGAGHGNSHGDMHDISRAAQPAFLNHNSRKSTLSKTGFDENIAGYSGTDTPISFGTKQARHGAPDITDYFVGPRDLEKHSKLPYFLQMHGSILPKMIVPLSLIASWASLITCLHKFVTPLGVSTLLLTVLGFVVGLALSFRSSTAYERYSEGRKTWSALVVHCRNLSRYIWIHTDEREGELGKQDLLAKVTAMNLVLAFAVALKHKLRFEPFAHYADITDLVGHLDTFAKAAHKEEHLKSEKISPWKRVGGYLGLSMASSNPRKVLKRADKPLGNLPLEISAYLSAYIEEIVNNGTMKSPTVVGQMLTSLSALTDSQAAAERVLTTPLPVGYNILISQIVLLYVYLLPFQLLESLKWVTIPGTIAAAYIILGLASIGNELENPFGDDVNDLPLDQYCADLAKELNVMMSVKTPKFGDFVKDSAQHNKVLWPLSTSGYSEWAARPEADIRSALRAKVIAGKPSAPAGEKSRTPSLKESVV